MGTPLGEEAGVGAPAGQRASTSPLERVVDLLLHAPLGVVVTAREELPRLIAKGRQEAGGAKFIGKMAVDMGQREAGRLVRQASERLAALGLVPDPRRSSGPAGTPPGGAEEPPETTPSSQPSTEPAGTSPVTAAPAAAAPGPAAASLAIPGYDSLSAPQVVQRLDGLSDDELESVRAYESATRGRKTVLSRVAQLQSAS